MADLTGTTPANTYKGLLQVNDYTDGVDATAKYIQDGEGTDSALAISTGNVGIGTTSPSNKLDITANSEAFGISITNPGLNPARVTLTNGEGSGSIDANNGLLRLGNSSSEDLVIDSAGNVGIGTTSPSAPLEVSSTTGGVIMPRMTTIQRTAVSAVDGEMVYDTDLNKFYGYANGAWIALH